MNKKVFKKLPGIFQTEVQSKFFSATAEQMFSEKSSKKINAYIGRRVSGRYDPIKDYYKPEIDKERTWYQLEPSVVYQGENDTDVIFYQDFLNWLKYNGVDTTKQNRLFDTKYYSFDPPVNMDMIVNYQNYYWMPDSLPSVSISGVDDQFINDNIVGKESFKFSDYTETSFYSQLPFSNGVVLTFPDSTNYNADYIVAGNGSYIELVERLPITFDINYLERNDRDYFVIDVRSSEKSLWARNNRWIEKDIMFSVFEFLGQSVPDNVQRARRPIFEYEPDIALYGFGKTFHSIVDYFSLDHLYADIDGSTISEVEDIVNDNNILGKKIFLPLSSTSNVWEINDDGFGNVSLFPFAMDPFNVGDIVYDYRNNSIWYDGMSFNVSLQKKTKRNQPILFDLFDINGISLSDSTVYPESNFDGNYIFFYKINESLPIDSELDIRIEYKSLSQGSDIVMKNYLYGRRYEYISDDFMSIDGFYYYRKDVELFNMWSISDNTTEQKVIHKYGVLEDGETDFEISVSPINGSSDKVKVTVNGIDTNDFAYSVQNQIRNVVTVISPDLVSGDDVEISVVSSDSLDPMSPGYFSVPKQIDVNAMKGEIDEYTYGEFIGHFKSIINNQPNPYIDSKRDGSLGTEIIIPEHTLLHALQISNKHFGLVDAIEHASKQYSTFKSRFIEISKDYAVTMARGSSKMHDLLSKVLEREILVREYSDSFSYSFMVNGRSPINEGYLSADTISGNTIPYVFDYNNVYYGMDLYKVSMNNFGTFESQVLLLLGIDYEINEVNGYNTISFIGNNVSNGDDVLYRVYYNQTSYKIPPSSAKLGISKLYTPEIYNDDTYSDPQTILIGHDGSRYILEKSYTDYEISLMTGSTPSKLSDIFGFAEPSDILLYELEKEIYNNVSRNIHNSNYETNSVWDFCINPFNTEIGEYTHIEISDLWKKSFTKWTAVNRLDYYTNNTYNFGDWKTYNYSDLKLKEWNGSWVDTNISMPGSWRAIYLTYFRTVEPDKKPWEMLGFSIKPLWWEVSSDNGDGFTGYGNDYSSNNTVMWSDIEQGIIRRGHYAGISKYTYPGLTNTVLPDTFDLNGDIRSVYSGTINSTNNIPVDLSGSIRTIDDIFSVSINDYNPEKNWSAGDLGPVEWSWYNSSESKLCLFLVGYLMKPALYSSKYWDPSRALVVGTQTLNSDTKFMFDDNSYVHGENTSDGIYVSSGYQQIISDYLLSLSKDIRSFGDLIRSSRVSLSHKFGGFVNSETLKVFLDYSTTSSIDTGNLLVPVENYEVLLHKGSPIDEYVYSGVMIRVEEDSTFGIYGYDLSKMAFEYYPEDPQGPYRSVSKGGKPASYMKFEYDEKYDVGTLVEFMGSFYVCDESHVAYSFDNNFWTKLSKLPVVGGLSVKYRTKRKNEKEVIPYGTKFRTIDEVYSFLIGYGKLLEDRGWIFENDDTGNLENWESSADKFLFWATTEWSSGNTLLLSPSSSQVTLEVSQGYPDNVETSINGLYGILNQSGLPVDKQNTVIQRDDRKISIINMDQANGIFYCRVTASESEHIITLDNITEFSDLIYDPIIGSRQPRLRLSGVISKDWIGKYEAPGYIISGNKLLPNIENIVDSSRFIYSTEKDIDDEGINSAAKHIIGFESKEYLDSLDISGNTQINFYKGFVREKGTWNAISKVLRSKNIENKEDIGTNEVWAFNVSEYGHNNSKTTLSFNSNYENIKGDPQIYSIHNNIRSNDFSIESIDIYGADIVYTEVPTVLIEDPQLPDGIKATAIAHLSSDMKLDYIEVTNPGKGYSRIPWVVIDGSTDKVFANISSDVSMIESNDSQIIDLNILSKDDWAYRINYDNFIDKIPKKKINRIHPTAGYVSFNDVDHYVFDDILSVWENKVTPTDLIWVAKLPSGTWGILSQVSVKDVTSETSEIVNIDFTNILSGTLSRNLVSQLPYSVFENVNKIKSSVAIITYYNQGEQVYSQVVDIKNTDNNNYLVQIDGISKKVNVIYSGPYDYADINVLYNRRFRRIEDLNNNSVISINEKVWVDDIDGNSQHMLKDGTVIRKSLSHSANTEMFDQVKIYSQDNKVLDSIQVYDPIQGIYLSVVDENVNFMLEYDPVIYSNGPSEYLGKVWVDTSSCPLVDYLIEKSASESDVEIIKYRNSWYGKVFPGSTVDVYEFIVSEVPPDQYFGEVFNKDKFIVERIYNPTIKSYEVKYYFWIKNSPKKILNREYSTADIRNYIVDPINSGLGWYGVTGTSDTTLSVSITDTNRSLSSNNVYIDLSFSRTGLDSTCHSEWDLVAENSNEYLPERVWEKMVDSIVGYTSPGPLYSNFTSKPLYPSDQFISVVPSPELTEMEKYGLANKPQQSVFSNKKEAARVAIEIISRNVVKLKLWESKYTGWQGVLPSSKYWKFVDWFKEGINPNDIDVKFQVETTGDMQNISDLSAGDYIRVYPSNPDQILDRYEVYYYDGNSFDLVQRELGTIAIDHNIYSDSESGIAKDELRGILESAKNFWFTGLDSKIMSEIFFELVYYSISENKSDNWCFKTSLVNIVRNGISTDESRFYVADNFSNFIDYFGENKPYHTKVNDVLIRYNTRYDNLNVGIEDLRSMRIKIYFVRVGNGTVFYSQPMPYGWDSVEWDSVEWDRVSDYERNSSLGGTMFGDTSVDKLVSETPNDELLPISPNENIIIDTVNDAFIPGNDFWGASNWDIDPWDSPTDYTTSEVGYRMHIHYNKPYGEYSVLPKNSVSTLVSPINNDSSAIVIDNDDFIQTSVGSTVWIDNEVIRYDYVDFDGTNYVLSGLQRGYFGTGISDHSTGAKVQDASYKVKDGFAFFMEDGIMGKSATVDSSQTVNTFITVVDEEGAPVDSIGNRIPSGTPRYAVSKPVPLTNSWYDYIDISQAPYNQVVPIGEESKRMVVTSSASKYLWRNKDL